MKKYLFSLVVLFAVAAVSFASPYLFSSSVEDWDMHLIGNDNGKIEPMTVPEGQDYRLFWESSLVEGEPFSEKPIQWMPAELYLYEPALPDPNYPDEECLVMSWQTEMPDENYSAGWTYTYDVDPDLTNCTIKISVFAPNWINNVSFWLRDINGNQVAWKWNVPTTIPHNATVLVQIDTSQISAGLAASVPQADSFAMLAPGFDIKQVVSFGVTENAFTYGNNPIPPIGGSVTNQAWNAWSHISIIRNDTKAYKGYYVKWSQIPEVIEDMFPPMIYGWDQYSIYDENIGTVIMATDDWKCTDPRPITDVHWWGSFVGWTQPYLPKILPDYFMMCIWTDIPANVPGPDGTSTPYSRPNECVWTHKCDNWVWNFAGYDQDPRFEFADIDPRFGDPQENEACFQFNQLLSEDSWFWQEGGDDTTQENIYWISIAAVYLNTEPEMIEHPWGWKTRPHKNLDVAGVITDLSGQWPPFTCGTLVSGFFPLLLPDPDRYPEGVAFDLAFELTTNEQAPCYGLIADLNHNCIVDFYDFAIFANQWLDTE